MRNAFFHKAQTVKNINYFGACVMRRYRCNRVYFMWIVIVHYLTQAEVTVQLKGRGRNLR